MGKLMALTKEFALDIIRFVESLPNGRTCFTIGNQLLRAGTSVGSNYRSATRARSRADFIAKLKIVEEECDESIYWVELLVETGKVKIESIGELLSKANMILAMTIASIKTARTSR